MTSKITGKLADFTAKRFGAIIAIVLVFTLIFLAAMVQIESNTSAEAMNAQTDVYKAYQRYEDNFRPSMHGIPVVCEAKDGNILNMKEFRDIEKALDLVENDTKVKPMLVSYFDYDLLGNKTSVNSISDSVELIMDGDADIGYQLGYHNYTNMGNDFTSADDDDLNSLLTHLFQLSDEAGTYVYREIVSADLTQKNGKWHAPVVMLFVAVDNNILEENYTYKEEGEKGKEYFEKFDLHVLQILKDNIETCNVHGVGVGVNDEIQKEINESGPFMLFTFIIIVIILAITFKNNLKSFLAATIGLPLVIIWMNGSAKLIGLSETQFTAFLPILIMALSVDYAIHSMKRFDEELIKGKSPRESVHSSISRLTGTLALAMLTTCVAFFSNFLSVIPALRDWGLQAGLAIIWTFIIMGLFVPALRLAFESSKKRDMPYLGGSDTDIKDGKKDKKKNKDNAKKDEKNGDTDKSLKKFNRLAQNRVGAGLSRLSFGSISRPSIIIVILILLVIPLGYGAFNLSSDFELEEFFNPESDLIVGLDMYTEHFPKGGEPNILLIEGDIADPDVLKAINGTEQRYRARGYATWYGWDVAQIVQNFTKNQMINRQIALSYGLEGVNIVDSDNDLIPDSAEQIHAILKQVRQVGLWIIVDGNPTNIIRPDYIKEIIHYNEEKDEFDKTIMVVGVSGSGSLDVIKEGVDNMNKDAQLLEDTGKVETVVTGTAPIRYEQLTAISNSMLYSIVISIIVCFIIILAVFRRLSISLIAILPVILISIWLYGIMYFTGSNLNIVTATIGAMSIGVGVDYSIHVCDRFRKERAEGKDFNKSMDTTVSNSGAALLFSALTTSFGFFVMLFAPMPMFFSFGLYSGLMVLFAFIASVLVVPPLIRFAEREKKK